MASTSAAALWRLLEPLDRYPCVAAGDHQPIGVRCRDADPAAATDEARSQATGPGKAILANGEGSAFQVFT
jgi:hypothetical protein